MARASSVVILTRRPRSAVILSLSDEDRRRISTSARRPTDQIGEYVSVEILQRTSSVRFRMTGRCVHGSV